MTSRTSADAGRMSVSIVAGSAARSVIDKLGAVSVFDESPGLNPEQIIDQLRMIADKAETNDLVIPCAAERPAMAYASLFADPATGLSKLAQVTRVVFAIDATLLLDALLDRKSTNLSPIFCAEQIEFVTNILLDGAINDPDFELARELVATLNPTVRIGPLNAALSWANERETEFTFEEALNRAGWRKLLEPEQPQVSPANKTTAFGYHGHRPFHPDRFWTFLQKGMTGVFRAKGFFWLATRMNEVGGLNLAGSELQCASAGHWWAARDAETRESQMPRRTREQWREPFGDRRQYFSVMALGVDYDSLRHQLETCLLTEDEMGKGEDQWRGLTDPFPSWEHVHHHDHHECNHDHDSNEDCCHH